MANTPWGALAAGAGAIVNLGLGIAGMVKTNKLQKQYDKLSAARPSYNIPTEYTNALNIYKKNAAMSGLPGQDLIEQNIQQSSARARTAAERGAISSTSYGELTGDIYEKELQAIQDLGIKAAEFQFANQGQLAQGYQMMGAQQEKAQDWNVLSKWATQMNQTESMLGASRQNMQNAFGNVASGLLDFAGTSYMTGLLKRNK